MRRPQRIVTAFLICAGFALGFAGRTFAEDITISSDTTWQPGAYTYGNVLVTNGATLTFNGAVTLNAQNLTIDSTSSISADGKGYLGSQGPGVGGNNGAGAGYGGKGRSHAGSLGGPIYGSAIAPVDIGSGGGATGWNGVPGGSGGGAIRINVSETLTLNGVVSANGNEFSKDSYYAGGGSGGSVYIITKNLTGSGNITANGGGKTSINAGGGGGGGRIAVYYESSTFAGNIEAKGGIGSGNGDDGTVVSIDTPNNTLYPGHSFRFQENDSPFNFDKIILNNSHVNSEGSFNLTTSQMLLENSSLSLGGSSSVKTNILSLQDSSSLTLNDTSNLTVVNSSTLTNSSLTFTGSQSLSVPSLTLKTSTLTLSGKETLGLTNLTLNTNSIFTSIQEQEGKINLNLYNLTIDSTSSISADGKGYLGSQGPGVGDIEAGAGYGGKGGNINAFLGGSTYGFAIAPVDMGSGGGILTWNGVPGGSGGGAIRINVSETLTLNGVVSANGNEFSKDSYYAGGGSGGSVYIITKNLTGSGNITANGGGKTSINAGGGGGGGRIAVYYKTSTFSGTAKAKGGIGWQNGEDGTIVFQPISLDTPLTTFNLLEKSSTASTLQETLSTQELALNNVQVSGDLIGTLDFTKLTLITLSSGVFSGKGFLESEFATTLEGVSYQGNLQGVVYPDPKENKLHLKASIPGLLINGIAEATLTESTPGSGVYDKYQATWKLNRLGTDIISATLNLEGTVSYQPSSSFVSGVYIYQGNFESDALGSYSGPLSAVLTHLRLTGDNEYKGKGFSLLSYNSLLGQGDGYSYNRVASEGIIDFQGLFQSPLLGKLQATLDETKNPKTFSGTIERLDLGTTPASDLKVNVWGATRVSPGQTVNNIIEIRNDGLKEAKDVELINELPFEAKYLSNTGNGTYDEANRDITWDFVEVGAKTKKYLSTTQSINWGLADNTKIGQSVYQLQEKPVIDPTAKVEGSIIDVTDSRAQANMIISNKDTSVNLTVELTMTPIIGEPQEPVLGQNITAENVEYYGAIALDNTYIANTPFLVSYGFGIASRIEGEGGIADRVSRAIRVINTGINIINGVLGYQKDATMVMRDQNYFNFARQQGRISEESLNFYTDRNIAQRMLRPVITLMRSLIPYSRVQPTLFPLPNDNAVDRIQGIFREGKMRNFHYASLAEQTKMVGAGILNDIKDPSDIKREFLSTFKVAGYHVGRVAVASDPNELFVSPEGDVRPGDRLSYTINYENEGEGDAYGVYITDTLEEDLDDTTLVVNGGGKYNPATRTISWFIGELLSKQKGSVTFSVNVKQDAQDKQEVINFATVYFPSVPEITRTNGTVNKITTYIDNAPPVTTAVASPLPNSAGWNNSDVTVTLSAVDNEGGSGLSKTEYSLDNINWTIYAAPFIIADQGTITVYYKSTDNLNNTESAKSLEVKIDKTPPTISAQISPQPNSAGWNNSDVTVSFTAADTLSGVSTSTQPQSITTEGKDQIIGGEAVDIAGNSATIEVSINLDKTPPTITATSFPEANPAGWNNTDVTVSFAGEDSLSGIKTLTAPIIVTTEGQAQEKTGEAIDFADNQASASLTLNIDKTPPEILLELKPINLSEKDEKEDEGNWYELVYSATDLLSGLKSLEAGLAVISLAGFNPELEVDEELEIRIDENKRRLKIEAPNPRSALEDLKDSLFNLNTNQILQLKVKQGEPKWKLKQKTQGFELQAPSIIFKAIASDIADNTVAKELEFRKENREDED